MGPQGSAIPPFRADGYLPEALYLASEAEVLFRFGTATRRRRRLALRLRRWIELIRSVGGQRLLHHGQGLLLLALRLQRANVLEHDLTSYRLPSSASRSARPPCSPS